MQQVPQLLFQAIISLNTFVTLSRTTAKVEWVGISMDYPKNEYKLVQICVCEG